MDHKSILIGSFHSAQVISEYYARHVSSVEAIIDQNNDSEIMILGDYNLRETYWFNYSSVSEDLLVQCKNREKKRRIWLGYYAKFAEPAKQHRVRKIWHGSHADFA